MSEPILEMQKMIDSESWKFYNISIQEKIAFYRSQMNTTEVSEMKVWYSALIEGLTQAIEHAENLAKGNNM